MNNEELKTSLIEYICLNSKSYDKNELTNYSLVTLIHLKFQIEKSIKEQH